MLHFVFLVSQRSPELLFCWCRGGGVAAFANVQNIKFMVAQFASPLIIKSDAIIIIYKRHHAGLCAALSINTTMDVGGVDASDTFAVMLIKCDNNGQRVGSAAVTDTPAGRPQLLLPLPLICCNNNINYFESYEFHSNATNGRDNFGKGRCWWLMQLSVMAWKNEVSDVLWWKIAPQTIIVDEEKWCCVATLSLWLSFLYCCICWGRVMEYRIMNDTNTKLSPHHACGE